MKRYQNKILAFFLLLSGLLIAFIPAESSGKSLDLGVNNTGISIGNSKSWNGLRINFMDRDVQRIRGINLTFWRPKANEQARISGISVGLVAPSAGYLSGVNIGGIGVAAENKLSGLSVALVGMGSGGSISGICIAGIGAGSGESISGITVAGLGAGSGGNIKGVTIAGLGAGAQGDIQGITLAILGAGSGQDITGLTVAGLGAGAGGNINGITIGGLGAGCGGELKGIAIGGLGAGAPVIKGIALGGIGVGGEQVHGITATFGMMKVQDGGQFSGLAVGSYNRIKGKQTGISLGLLNYAWQLHGIQIGVLNIVRENPAPFKVLPFINARF